MKIFDLSYSKDKNVSFDVVSRPIKYQVPYSKGPKRAISRFFFIYIPNKQRSRTYTVMRCIQLKNIIINEFQIYTNKGKLVEFSVHYEYKVTRNREEQQIFVVLDDSGIRVLQYGDKGFIKRRISKRVLYFFLQKAKEEFEKVKLKAVVNEFYPIKPPIMDHFNTIITKEKFEEIKKEAAAKFLNKTMPLTSVYLWFRDHDVVMYVNLDYFDEYFTIFCYEPVYSDFHRFKYPVISLERYIGRVDFRTRKSDSGSEIRENLYIE